MSGAELYKHSGRASLLVTADAAQPLRPIISPSILASDFAQLQIECADVLSAKGGSAEWLHVDVMDGHFVPNISIGPCVVAALRKHFPETFLDVHCMITSPEKWVAEMAKAGASQFTFHIEATEDPADVAKRIRDAGMLCGVAIKPGTPVTPALQKLVEDKAVDMVLVMTVEPGFGGQSFMADTMPKVKALRAAYPHLNIQVDGGLTEETTITAAQAGANVVVAGTSIFKAKDRAAATNAMRAAIAAVTQ